MSNQNTNVKTIWFASSFLFLAHFVIDSAAQFPMALIPVLREKLGFSLTLAFLIHNISFKFLKSSFLQV